MLSYQTSSRARSGFGRLISCALTRTTESGKTSKGTGLPSWHQHAAFRTTRCQLWRRSKSRQIPLWRIHLWRRLGARECTGEEKKVSRRSSAALCDPGDVLESLDVTESLTEKWPQEARTALNGADKAGATKPFETLAAIWDLRGRTTPSSYMDKPCGFSGALQRRRNPRGNGSSTE